MGKPRLIILIRHAQSEGNKNRDIHQTIPDHRVKLTQDGWQQAYEAGRRLRKLLRPDDTLHFFTSPYRRTRETTEGILATLTSEEPESSPFKRENIKVYEEPRLREQDFGNFQPCSAEMERMWQERADYGHFFYRIPNGESAADAYDRISGFNESLWRQFGEDDFASVCVLVTHGLMSRVFLMKWYHFSVEYFEDLRNVNHCEFLIMRQNDKGKYILENKLRTWSELKRQSAIEVAKEKAEGKENGASKDDSKLTRASTINIQRKWGGCPNGCNHDKSFKIRQNLADLVKSDSIISNHTAGLAVSESNSNGGSSSSSSATATNSSPSKSSSRASLSTAQTHTTQGIVNPSFNGTANSVPTSTIVSRRPAATKRFQSISQSQSQSHSHSHSPSKDDDEDDNNDDVIKNNNKKKNPSIDISFAVPTGPQIDVTKARDEVVSSPDGTPSFISVDDRLRNHLKSPASTTIPPPPFTYSHHIIGRDFGGTLSGHSSVASVSDDGDSSEDESRRHIRRNQSLLGVTSIPGVSSSSSAVESSRLTPGGGVRTQSRMGRGVRAHRLGDHHSSDGHSTDGGDEHEHDCVREGEVDGDGSSDDHLALADDESNGGAECGTPELARTLSGEVVDERVLQAEREDKSIMGSVY
ncbi:broad-range acid phosphatase DET1 [Cladorrhinum samala]|uniref:Broad-range acid phosphatase DET1 n=1 Tax=Cladorrhinum samala TaxID=585594 RepID=A0AAV9HNN9_9PEZI|nr:broad-range acid phosphatase DET1 [Cladorrhinum samala]